MVNDRAFLQAICAAPDDDVPRLVYADWLEEHGRAERAEFIRAQVELAGRKQDSPRRRELAWRARELLEQHEKQWVQPLRLFLHDWQFCRGFIERVELMGGDLEEHADDLFVSTPVRRLWVAELGGSVECLNLVPVDNALTGLDLSGNDLDAVALERLATLPQLRRLKVLTLLFNLIDDAGARLLCEYPFFQGLSLIRCGANPLTEEARQMLAAHFGERVSFVCERDHDHLYAFQDDYAFVAGFGRDHTQLLFLASDTEVCLAIFDHQGNLLEIQRRSIPQEGASNYEQRDRRRREAREAWMKEWGFQSATIKVKRFRFDDVEGVYDFNWWVEAFERPGHPQRAELRGAVERWLATGQFVYNFGGSDCWLDRTGEVTDT